MPVLVSMDADGWLRFEFPICAEDAQPSLTISDFGIGGSSSVSYFARGRIIPSDTLVSGTIDPYTLAHGTVTSDLPRESLHPYSTDIRGIDDIGRLSVSTDNYHASANIGDLGLTPGSSVVFAGYLGQSGSSLRTVIEETGRAEIESWCSSRQAISGP